MDSVNFAILSGRKNSDFVISTVSNIRSKYSQSAIMICWPDKNAPTEITELSNVVIFDSSNMNMSRIRNAIIDFAKGAGRYVAMIEDDIEIVDISVVDRYIELMSKFNLGFTFYPFGGDMNRVFGIPNYNVMICKKIDGIETPNICTVSKPASNFFIIDSNIIDSKFDESLTYFEMRDFLINSKNRGVIPFLGMFFDLPESWKYFKTIKSKRVRNLVIDGVKSEQNRLVQESRWEWNAENQIVELLKFISGKLGIVCRR